MQVVLTKCQFFVWHTSITNSDSTAPLKLLYGFPGLMVGDKEVCVPGLVRELKSVCYVWLRKRHSEGEKRKREAV